MFIPWYLLIRIQEDNVDPTTALAAHVAGTITEGTFGLSSILHVIQQQKGGKKVIPGYRVEVQTGCLSSATQSGLQGLWTPGQATKKSTQKKEVLPGKMVVWIPSSVLEWALPALVAHFQKARNAKAGSAPTSTSAHKAVHDLILVNPDTFKGPWTECCCIWQLYRKCHLHWLTECR